TIPTRRSRLSSIARRSSENSTTGRATGVCTRATVSAGRVISSISQAAPTDWISPPKLDSRLATQMLRKTGRRKGASAADRESIGGILGGSTPTRRERGGATRTAREVRQQAGTCRLARRTRSQLAGDQTPVRRLGLSIVPVHLGEPQRQAQIFFSRAVCGSSRRMP